MRLSLLGQTQIPPRYSTNATRSLEEVEASSETSAPLGPNACSLTHLTLESEISDPSSATGTAAFGRSTEHKCVAANRTNESANLDRLARRWISGLGLGAH